MAFELVSNDTPIPRDVKPDLDEDEPLDGTPDVIAFTGYSDEAPYGYTATGRIRKRPVGSRANAARKPGASNEKLARQAAQVLAQINEAICLPLTMFGLTMTAGAIVDKNPTFEEQAYSALLPDPALCRSILRVGGTSARMSLLLAYGMFGMSVATHAYPEISAIRDARRERKAS